MEKDLKMFLIMWVTFSAMATPTAFVAGFIAETIGQKYIAAFLPLPFFIIEYALSVSVWLHSSEEDGGSRK